MEVVTKLVVVLAVTVTLLVVELLLVKTTEVVVLVRLEVRVVDSAVEDVLSDVAVVELEVSDGNVTVDALDKSDVCEEVVVELVEVVVSAGSSSLTMYKLTELQEAPVEVVWRTTFGLESTQNPSLPDTMMLPVSSVFHVAKEVGIVSESPRTVSFPIKIPTTYMFSNVIVPFGYNITGSACSILSTNMPIVALKAR